jgi:histidinol dehydrogenase
VQLAKGAIAAGIRTLMEQAQVTADEIETVYIAGGFGSHLDIASAAQIGLIPGELAEKVRVLGNAALSGAAKLLLDRREIARESIGRNGKIIVAENLRTAIDIANEIAPEHLELCVDQPFDYLDSIRHAGSVFLGRNCPEALGDYLAGPNHTLPTQGTARFSSPLSVDDFVKKTQYTYYTREALARVAEDVALFARKEGLTGHARSALIRTETAD